MIQEKDQILNIFLKLLSASVNNNGSLFNDSLTQSEWEQIISLSRKHNILPLIFEIASENTSFINLEEYQQLSFEVMSIVAGQTRRTEAFLLLYKQFLKADIHPIVLKGLICRQLYGEFCDHRPSGDEDILIQRLEYWKCREILIKNNYNPEHDQITEEQLNKMQEVTFFNSNTGLSIEVHINPMGMDSTLRRRMNNYFTDVFETCVSVEVNSIPIATMNATYHALFLIFHAFRHFTSGGFGIRQVLDIMLFLREFDSEINWDIITE